MLAVAGRAALLVATLEHAHQLGVAVAVDATRAAETRQRELGVDVRLATHRGRQQASREKN
jgi:hypothetical protein